MSDNKDKKRLGWENKPDSEKDTNINVKVETPPTVEKETVIEKKKTVVEEDDKSDDTPTPGTSSS